MIRRTMTSVWEFLAERFPVEKMDLQHMVQGKTVPVHRMSWAYYLGGITLFLFLIQVVTGLMLLFYYQPTVNDAFESVQYITEEVPGGHIIRNLHAWSASAMIFFVLAHLVTTFAMKAFAKPREVTWLAGIGLLLITFGFGFSGYLLPWNQIAVNATKIGLQSIEAMGQYLPASMAHLPTQLKEIIQGEASVGQATLSRFFVLHVVVLPLISFGLIGIHLFSVQLHGMSKGIPGEVKRTEKFFPTFIIKDFSTWGAVFFIMFILALTLPFDAFFSFPLMDPYNARGSTPDGIKPEWYFYMVYYPLEMLPYWLVMLAVNGGIVVLLLAPWIFKHTSIKTLRTLAVGFALYFVIITLFGDVIYHLVKGGA